MGIKIYDEKQCPKCGSQDYIGVHHAGDKVEDYCLNCEYTEKME
jgi:ribosomal protein S27AE|tara:strand:- start:10912 stop:11043 length:132 start_codon:yes stop_codon:yes gene_type:complete